MNKSNVLQAVKFALFSISAGVIETVTFILLNEVAKLTYWPAYLTALILSILWNFTFNRRFTFRSTANVPVAMAKIFVFYLFFTPLSTWLGNMAASKGVNEYIVLALTMAANFVLEFLYSKFIVYRGQENTIDTKDKDTAENIE